MHIGTNMRRLEGQRLGIGRYLENLLVHWRGQLRGEERMTLYLRRPLENHDAWIARDYPTEVIGPALTGVSWENISLPRRLKDVDVFFGPSYSLPLAFRGPSVVAIHSHNELSHNAHSWWYHLTYTQLYKRSAHMARKVIVPSKSVLEGLHRHYGIAHDKLVLIREGAPTNFKPIRDQEVLRRTRLEYTGREEPYILFVGKFSARRNIPLLIRAFARLKRQHAIEQNLLLLGPNHLGLPLDELITELGMQEFVTVTNRKFAEHEDIIPVFSAADLYAFPSTNEGASNTCVEAMACGVPVVAGRSEAIADIVEGHGLLIDRIDEETLADAMAAVLLDDAQSAAMRQSGLDRAAGLRWDNTAEQTLAVIREAAG